MEIKEKCRVTWCNNHRKIRSIVCELHSQYKHICGAAIRLDRPHLMYKVEKWLKGEHQCESCGFDPVTAYPTLHTKAQSSMLDVDHIDGNHQNNDPENLQTLCANCHRLKTYVNRDWKEANE